jgi:hypothetical protein
MFAWQPAPVLVLVPPVTVIAAVRRPDRVVLAADRAVVDPTRELVDGVPFLAPDRDKLFVTSSGIAVAMAGLVGGGSGVPDLLTAAADTVDTVGQVGRAADELRTLFAHLAPALRRAPAAATAATVVEPFERPVLTVALVAGAAPDGLLLYVVGLTADGQCELTTVTTPAVSYGPPQERASLAAAVEMLVAAPEADAAAGLRGVIESVAVRSPALVSVDCDTVAVDRHGAGRVIAHRGQGPSIPPGA